MEQNWRRHWEHPIMHKLFLFFITFLFINVLILDILLITNFRDFLSDFVLVSQSSETSSTADNSCPQSCVDKIDNEVASLSQSATAAAQVAQPVTATTTTGQSKEVLITLGSGSGASDEWQNVPGLQVTIDSTQYGRIKNAYFESSVYTPNTNQIAYARLYDVTDDRPVWFSEMTFTDAGVSKTQTSAPLILPEGKKTYAVQLKTQLKYTTNITSRILIETY